MLILVVFCMLFLMICVSKVVCIGHSVVFWCLILCVKCFCDVGFLLGSKSIIMVRARYFFVWFLLLFVGSGLLKWPSLDLFGS